jgi:hypothetical protein
MPVSCSGFYMDKLTSDWGGTKHSRVLLVTQLAGGAFDTRRTFRVQRPHFCGRVLESILHVRRAVGDLVKWGEGWTGIG